MQKDTKTRSYFGRNIGQCFGDSLMHSRACEKVGQYVNKWVGWYVNNYLDFVDRQILRKIDKQDHG